MRLSAKDPDHPDGMARSIAQRRCVQRRRDDLARSATRVETEVPRHAAVHDLADGGDELLGFRRAEEARDGLFQDLVAAKAEQLRDRRVRFQDLAAEIADEDRVGSVCDDDIGRERAAHVVIDRRISADAAKNHGREGIHATRSPLACGRLAFDDAVVP